jgi:NAD+ kinase
VVLGGDGLFVQVAKEAHKDSVQILGINFWTKGFLLHDREVFERDTLEFITQEYPILHTDISIWGEHFHGHAFNEVYLTRAGDASSIELQLSHRTKVIERYVGDGIMISTPAGSTGWSRSYGGIVLPHDANLNVITPLGKMLPKDFQPMVIADKWRIRIQNDTKRNNPIDILVDNRRIVAMENRSFDMIIERANRGVNILIEKWYLKKWENKPYEEVWFSS